MLPPFRLTEPSVLVFVILPVLLLVLLVWGTRTAWILAGRSTLQARGVALLVAVGGATWMNITWRLAARGLLLDFGRHPPPFVLVLVAVILIAGLVGLSRLGLRLAMLPLWVLVAVQSFRLPLELAMHQMATRGIMPPQMTFTGDNFDILTGATAVVVAALARAGRAPRALVLVWNVVGLALVVNVVVIGVLSTPMVRAFGDNRLNLWVLHAPFVWLPAVLVLSALVGHLVIFRRLFLVTQGRL